MSRSIPSRASLLWAATSAKNAADTRDNARPERSSAPIVLAKVGVAAAAAIAATLGPMAGDRRVEGGGEMLGTDGPEGRRPEWRRPVGEERIVAGRRRRGGIGHG